MELGPMEHQGLEGAVHAGIRMALGDEGGQTGEAQGFLDRETLVPL